MVLKFVNQFQFLFVSLFLFIIFPQVALSEHEADHRYTIQGFVLDSEKKGVDNSDVKVLLDGKLIAQKTTDSRGFYKAQLHLHDPDYGKELEIVTQKGAGKVIVDFTLGDKEHERFHYINFIDGLLSEGEMSTSGVPQWIYFVVGGVLLLVIVIVMSGKLKGKKKSKQKKNKN